MLVPTMRLAEVEGCEITHTPCNVVQNRSARRFCAHTRRPLSPSRTSSHVAARSVAVEHFCFSGTAYQSSSRADTPASARQGSSHGCRSRSCLWANAQIPTGAPTSCGRLLLPALVLAADRIGASDPPRPAVRTRSRTVAPDGGRPAGTQARVSASGRACTIWRARVPAFGIERDAYFGVGADAVRGV